MVVPSFLFRHSYLPPFMMNHVFFLSSSLFCCSSVSEKILTPLTSWSQPASKLCSVIAKLDPLFIKTAPWNRIDDCSGAICSICDPQASELDAWPSSPWPPAQWCSSVLVRKSINLDLGPWGVVLHSLTSLQLSSQKHFLFESMLPQFQSLLAICHQIILLWFLYKIYISSVIYSLEVLILRCNLIIRIIKALKTANGQKGSQQHISYKALHITVHFDISPRMWAFCWKRVCFEQWQCRRCSFFCFDFHLLQHASQTSVILVRQQT